MQGRLLFRVCPFAPTHKRNAQQDQEEDSDGDGCYRSSCSWIAHDHNEETEMLNWGIPFP